jgi:hypothetical protein
MFASTARVAQERNLMNNMRLEDEGRRELDSEFILPVTKRFAALENYSVLSLEDPLLAVQRIWFKKACRGKN